MNARRVLPKKPTKKRPAVAKPKPPVSPLRKAGRRKNGGK